MAKAEYKSSMRSKRLIYEALADLLLEKPLEKITVTELVRRADINRGTFYAHFTDIPDVANHILDQYFERISSVFSADDVSIEQWPDLLVQQIQGIFEEDSELTLKLASSSASSYIEQKLCMLMLNHLMQYEHVLPQLSHEGYLIRLRFCARGLTGLYHDWCAGQISMSMPELAETAKHLLRCIINDAT